MSRPICGGTSRWAAQMLLILLQVWLQEWQIDGVASHSEDDATVARAIYTPL